MGGVAPAVSAVVSSVARPIVKDVSRWSRWDDKCLYVLLLAACGSSTEGSSLFRNWLVLVNLSARY